ncbi:MAG: lipase family protein [Myxococcales bacterium]|jgi:hypothetical protein
MTTPQTEPRGHSFHETHRAEEKVERYFGARPTLSESFVDELLGRQLQYEPQLAYLSSVIAGWSYADGASLAKQLKFYGLPGASIEEFGVTNEVMYIVATAYLIRSRCGRVAFLAFRGTEPTNLVNWLTDADVAPRSFGGRGSVHRGFYTNLRSIWEDVSIALNQAMDGEGEGGDNGGGNGHGASRPLQRLYITGHSLGGAMAVLAGARILVEGNERWRGALSGIYTFGQPAVGDASFARQFESDLGRLLYRHEFRADAVPRLPPQTTGEFTHFGEARVSLSPQSRWNVTGVASEQAPFILATAASVVGSFVLRRIPALSSWDSKIFRYSLLDDHSPSRYIEVSRASLDG